MGMPGIVIEIGADTKDAISGINRVRGELGESLGGFERFRAGVNKAFVPAVAVMAAAGAAGIAFADAAAKDAQQADILALALRNNAGATDANIASTEAWITAQGKQLGFADDQLRPALGTLVRATKDVAGAQSAASLAMDIATSTGKPLEAVSAALAKGFGGNTAALGKLVPGLDKAVLASGDMTAIQAELAKAVGGSASKAASSAAGQMQRFKLSLEETKESIGAALLPILAKLQPYLAAFATWAQEHTPLIIAIVGAIVSLAAIIIVLKIAIEAWTVVQTILNAVMAANPIVLIVLAIVALVAIIYLAYQRFDGFRALVDAVWQGIQAATATVVDWYQTYLAPVISVVIGLIVGYFRTMLTIYAAIWQAILAAALTVVDWYQTYLAPVISVVIDLIKGYFTALAAAVGLVWTGLQTAAQTLVDWYQTYLAPVISVVIDLIKGYFTALAAAVGLVWTGIQAAAQAVADWFSNTLLPLFRKFWGLFSAGWEAIISTVKGLFTGVVQFFAEQADKWIGIGAAIVEGIKQGIAEKWDQFTSWFSDKASAVVDGIKGIFHINSPSRVFADIGRQIVAGWRIGLSGIDGVNSDVLASARGLVSALPTMAGQTSSSSSAGSGFGAAQVSDEQVARALAQLLMNSDLRNGRLVGLT